MLALKEDLKPIWNEAGDQVDGILSQLISKEVMSSMKENFVKRMFTKPAGAARSAKLAAKDPGASMRLMPPKMMDMMKQAFEKPA